MIGNRFVACGILCAMLLTAGAAVGSPAPAAPQTSYTPAEYNAYTAALTETDLQKRISMLDDFVVKFPNSTLLSYVYQLEYQTYGQLKNYAQAVAYVDKLLSLGSKIDEATKLTAYYARAQAYYLGWSSNDKALTAPDAVTAARNAAVEGEKVLAAWQKPANMTDAQFAQQKKSAGILFHTVEGLTANSLKDYSSAETAFKAVLADDPDNALTYYWLGAVYFQLTPPQPMDGFWAIARAIALKVPGDAQVHDYLRKRLAAYQQSPCNDLTDAELNDLIQLAGKSADPAPDFTIPSVDALNKVRQTLTIPQIMTDLQAGGDKAKTTWLAACGLEFPQVPAKVIAVTPGTDNVDLQLATGPTDDAIQAATTANMDAKVVDQPEASRLQKDDELYFSGTLVSYDPNPFMLHWDKAKVDPQYIPSEKETGKHHPRQLHKKP